MEDSEIINLYVVRSENAIKETNIKYGNYCKKISNNILKNISDVEECVNDTYLKTWNSIPPTIPKLFKAYIGRIARNLSIMVYRKNNRIKRGNGTVDVVLDELSECIPDRKSVEDEIENSRIVSIIDDFLSELSNEHRIIFMRRYWYTDSIATISKRCNMSESNVKVILHRIRKKLNERLIREDVNIY